MILFNIGFTAARVSYVVHRFFVKAGPNISWEDFNNEEYLLHTMMTEIEVRKRSSKILIPPPLPFSLSGPGELKARTLDIKSQSLSVGLLNQG